MRSVQKPDGTEEGYWDTLVISRREAPSTSNSDPEKFVRRLTALERLHAAELLKAKEGNVVATR